MWLAGSPVELDGGLVVGDDVEVHGSAAVVVGLVGVPQRFLEQPLRDAAPPVIVRRAERENVHHLERTGKRVSQSVCQSVSQSATE